MTTRQSGNGPKPAIALSPVSGQHNKARPKIKAEMRYRSVTVWLIAADGTFTLCGCDGFSNFLPSLCQTKPLVAKTTRAFKTRVVL
ncbi:hypothetical protein ACS3UN_09290 [Oscillospiraceae bacterium LTW-04]|nr:hypothetical protein RBH76_11050 [Oscillospiraceae bacterium MB24-C1]